MKSPFPDIAAAENVARLYTVLRFGEAIRWTDNATDITVGDDTWTAEAGAQMSSAEFHTDGTVSNAQLQLAARSGGPLSDADVAIGRYDGSTIAIVCVDTGNLAASPSPFGQVFVGYVGSVSVDTFGLITITARGPLTKLRGDRSERYGPMCRRELGDAFDANPSPGGGCRAVIVAPDIARSTAYVAGDDVMSFVRVRAFDNDEPSDYANLYWECTTAGTTASVQPDYTGDLTPGDTVTDGTAVFTARNAWLRAAEVDGDPLTPQSFALTESPDPRAVTGWFTLGTAIIRTGRYAGTLIPVRGWDADLLRVRAWWPVSHMIESGTLLEIHPGCAKTEAACQGFGQIINRLAEPFIPGRDAALALA